MEKEANAGAIYLAKDDYGFGMILEDDLQDNLKTLLRIEYLWRCVVKAWAYSPCRDLSFCEVSWRKKQMPVPYILLKMTMDLG